ncbi:MAG: hypothetical protein OEY49_15620, partial [Candidatus Heimdallarchaeota archaeon]|nr:hypothetical protein [Candidatus Heimdallarchaeota archaeon]
MAYIPIQTLTDDSKEIQDFKIKSITPRSIPNILRDADNPLSRTGNNQQNIYSSAAVPPVIATERVNNDGFTYGYNETYSNAVYDQSNGYVLNTDPTKVNSNMYNQIDIDVNASTSEENYIFEDTGLFFAVTSTQTYAQGIWIPELNISNSINLSSLHFKNGGNFDEGMNLTLELWTAVENGTLHKVPNTKLTTSSYFIGASNNSYPSFIFNFTQPVTIQQQDTYTNSNGGYIFAVIYRTDGNGGATAYLTAKTSTATNSILYQNITTTHNPSSNWGKVITRTINIKYNASFILNPDKIGTKVYSNPSNPTGVSVGTAGGFQSNGGYQNTSTVDAIASYNITFDSALIGSITEANILMNISYTLTYHQTFLTNSVTFDYSPTSSLVNWTIYYNLANSYIVNSSRYFLLPSAFTNLQMFVNLAPSSAYTLTPGSVYDTINLQSSVGTGNITITAQTLNLFEGLSITRERSTDGLSWVPSTFAYMGILVDESRNPSPTNGNFTRASIDTSAFSAISSGSVNASLRDPNGNIVFANYSSLVSWSPTLLSFVHQLDENLETGTWSFQFRWSNSTAAAAIAIEFDIFPVVRMQLINPTSLNFLEANDHIVQIGVLDQSHGIGFVNNPTLTWTEEANQIMAPNGQTTNYYLYDYTITPDNGTFPTLTSGTHTTTITVEDKSFVQNFNFDFELFFRGDTRITGPTARYDKNFSFFFQPRSITNNGENVFLNPSDTIDFILTYTNTSGSVVLVNQTDYLGIYDNGGYNFTIYWNDWYNLGTDNSFELKWNMVEFRDIADDPYISKNFAFIIVDVDAPIFRSEQGPITIDELVPSTLSWRATDTFPANYTIYRENTQVQAGMWFNDTVIQHNTGGLYKGVHNFTIVLQDSDGNKVQSSVDITVNDNALPVIRLKPTTSSPTPTFSQGSTNNLLRWNLTDVHPSHYKITNTAGLSTQEGSWYNETFIDYTFNANLNLGTYSFTLFANDTSGNNVTDTFNIEIIDDTLPSITGLSNFEMRNNETVTLTWNIGDTNPYRYSLYRNGTALIGPLEFNPTDTVTYVFETPTIGGYNFTLILSDTTGNTAIYILLIRVKAAEITETQLGPDLTYTNDVYEGDIEAVTDSWENTNNNSISNARVTLNLYVVDVEGYESGMRVEGYTFVYYSTIDGTFTIYFNYTGLPFGDYRWGIEFAKYRHVNQTSSYFVSILPHSIIMEIEAPLELIQNENYTISALLTYDNPYGSISLSEFTQRRQGAVEGAIVDFEIEVTFTDGTTSVLRYSSEPTDATGVAIITIGSQTTADILSVNSISGSVQSQGIFSSTTTTIPAEQLPEVKLNDPSLLDLLLYNLDWIEEYIPVIITILSLLIFLIVYTIIKVKKKRKRIALINQEIENAVEELDGLLSIQAIVIKHSETGIPFYDHTFTDAEGEIDLAL